MMQLYRKSHVSHIIFYFPLKIDTLGKQPWLIIQAKEMVIHSDSKDTE